MNQGEGRTRDRGFAAQSGAETFDELSLTAAELAGEREHVAGLKTSRELPTERFGFLRAIGNERSHGEDVEVLIC